MDQGDPSAPWCAAAILFEADPARDLDPAALPSEWPEWAPLPAVLSRTEWRVPLGQWLCRELDTAWNAFADRPRARLALMPAADAVRLMVAIGGWRYNEWLRSLLRRADVAAVRTGLGEDLHDLISRRLVLLPRPDSALAAALSENEPAPETAFEAFAATGAAAFGLAIGAQPQAVVRRLAMRRPAARWAEVVRNAVSHPVGDAAFASVRRIAREVVPAWSALLN